MSAGGPLKKSVASETGGLYKRSTRSLDELTKLVEEHPMEDPDLSATELMLLTGSPRKDGFCPTPPSQVACLTDRREAEHIRVVACVALHTTRSGEGTAGRFPFARNPDHTPLTRSQIASKTGMRLPNASAAIDRAIEMGRIREDAKGRFWLRGNVPAPETGEQKAASSVQITLPKYLTERLQQLSEVERENFLQTWYREKELEDSALAESAAQVREVFASRRRAQLETIGIKQQPPKRKESVVAPAQRKPLVKEVQLDLPELSVQISSRLSVQMSKPAGVQITPSFIRENYYSEKDLKHTPPPLSQTPQEAELQESARATTSELQRRKASPISSGWHGFLLAVRSVHMAAPDGILKELQEQHDALSRADREAALDGILQRKACGQYDPQNTRWTPSARRYLKEQLWTEPLRVQLKPPKSDMDVYIDELMAEGDGNGE